MDNGAHKAGSPEAWQTVHDGPGLVDLYMLHTAEGSDAAHNNSDPLIANLKAAQTALTSKSSRTKTAASALPMRGPDRQRTTRRMG